MAVPVLKELSHLPVIVDPSHAAGRRDLVLPLSLAAAAAGADGIIVEVHPNPDEAICDGPQALRADEFAEYAAAVERAAALAGKALSARREAWPLSVASRRRADRRLDRPGRARGARAPRCAATTPTPRRRASGARARRDRRAGAPTSPTAVAGAEVVFVAAPVGALAGRRSREALAARRAGLRGHRRRLDQARCSPTRGADERFVGGHPLAGAETAGVEHAREDLFEGATWYLTPTRGSTAGVLYERLHRAAARASARSPTRDRRRRPTTG